MASTITRVAAWRDTLGLVVKLVGWQILRRCLRKRCVFTRFDDFAFYAVLVESTSIPAHFFSIQTSTTV